MSWASLPVEWVVSCDVCDSAYIVRAVAPPPTASFCPDCRERKLIAPGVLHWRRRSSMMKRGPKEQAVHSTLASRPAGIINNASNGANSCFAGFFNGARSVGTIFVPRGDSLSIGKAECEWDWRKTWGELKQLGLIDWREVEVPCVDGRKMIEVHLTITSKGHEVREDDLRWFRELMAAAREDEAERAR